MCGFPFLEIGRSQTLAKLRVAPNYEKVACVAGKEMEKKWNPFRKARFSNRTVAGWLLIRQFSEYEDDSLLTFFIRKQQLR